MRPWSKTINNRDGTVSWDVPLTRKGLIEPDFLRPIEQLARDIPPRAESGTCP